MYLQVSMRLQISTRTTRNTVFPELSDREVELQSEKKSL